MAKLEHRLLYQVHQFSHREHRPECTPIAGITLEARMAFCTCKAARFRNAGRGRNKSRYSTSYIIIAPHGPSTPIFFKVGWSGGMRSKANGRTALKVESKRTRFLLITSEFKLHQ